MSSEHDVACESVLFWPQRSTPVGIRQVALVWRDSWDMGPIIQYM